eukprot:1136280-Pelagomonas_calceolata.AAC.3
MAPHRDTSKGGRALNEDTRSLDGTAQRAKRLKLLSARTHTHSLDGTSQGHFKGRQGTSQGYTA